MPSKKRAAIAATLFSFASTILAVVTGFIFVPLYLGWVGAPAYGVWLASGNVLAWLSLIDPGIGDLARQRIAALLGEGQWRRVRATVIGGLLAMSVVAGFVAVIGTTFSYSMVSFLNVEDPGLRSAAVHAFGIAAGGSALVIVGTYLCGALQGLHLGTSAGVIGLTASILVPFVRLALLASGFSIASFAWATVCQGLVMCVGAGTILAHNLARHPSGPLLSLPEMRYLFSMSLFTSFTRIAGTISNNMLAALITRHLGPTATVSFEMTRQPIEIARTFLDKPASALLPSFAHLTGAGNTLAIRLYMTRYLRYLIWTLGLAVVGLSMLNESFITVWLSRDLFAGPVVNGLLVAGMVATAIGNCSRLFLYSLGRIALSSVASLIETLASVAIALVAVRVAGTTGLAATSALASLGIGVWIMPRIVLSGILVKSDRATLLHDALLPAIGAAALASATLWWSGAQTVASQSWLSLVLVSVFTTCVYIASLLILSPGARAEASAIATATKRRTH